MEIDVDEVQQLKALVAEQQERLDALERHVDAPNVGETKDKRSTRRQLLKLAGATLAGAAGSAALRAIPAAAADGNTVTVGNGFTETLGNATWIDARTSPGGTALLGSQSTGWGVWGYSTSGQGVHGNAFNGGTGVVAIGNGSGAGTGVNAFGNGTAVIANGGYTGVAAYGSNTGVRGASGYGSGISGYGHPGVFGYSSNGIAVQARSTYGYSRAVYAYASGTYAAGIQARSLTGAGALMAGATGAVITGNTYGGTYTYALGAGRAALLAHALGGGPDAVLNGTGRLVQYNGLAGGIGAPNFNPFPTFFESMRAADGTLWISGAQTTGTSQSRWRRVNAVRVDSSDGAGTPFKPKRVIDTRSGARKAAGSTTPVVVAPFGTGTSTIPADAVAIIGNLTAVNYTGPGFLAIMPAGVAYNPLTDPSSVNFIVGQVAIANSFVVGLGTGANAGKVQVVVAGHASHFIIDVTGYMQ